jgi:poly(hydroxyalkanoate) depolymerase family esterase
MIDARLAGMSEVLRLTRSGRLQEATSAIQRMARGESLASVGAEPVKRTEKEPIEGVPLRASYARHVTRHVERASPRPRPVPVGAPDAIGKFITGLYTNEAGTRSYKLYIPSGYRGQSLPLVVMLHGCTQGPDDFASGTRMNDVAEEQQCLVVYPAQAQGANPSKCWNWFKAGDQRRDQGEPSIVAGITRLIMSSHNIDPGRVYVGGLSAGGAMAVIMGMTYPELYAAVGVHSGLAYAAAHNLPSAFAVMRRDSVADGGMGIVGARGLDIGERAVPTIVFHGDRDTTVHPLNGEHVISQSLTARGSGTAGTGASSHVTVERGQAANGHAYTRTIYHDTYGHPSVEHWLVHGAGHAWSGGSPNGSFTDPKGPDATKEMIRFFWEHSQRAAQPRER